jgi:glyoxylase-like metal-dependent hydrolase (beta-lactamase superfamily II)
MFIKCLIVGQVETNCYILCDKVTNIAAIIDPGYDAQRIASALEDTECAPGYIILTHAHYDHFAAVGELKAKTGAQLVVLEDELQLLNDPVKNLYNSFEEAPFKPFSPELLLHDGDTLKLGQMELAFLHTPGHTAGSCCIVCQDVIFTGDTLFKETAGRTDLPTGSMEELLGSVRRLAALDGDYQIFPGHGDMTTLSHERECNPFLAPGDMQK